MKDLTREELNFLAAALSAYNFSDHTTREEAPSGKSFSDISDELRGKIDAARATTLARVRVTWVDSDKKEGPYEAEIVARRASAMDLRFIDDGYEEDGEIFTFEERTTFHPRKGPESLWFEINNHQDPVTIEDIS